MSSSLGANDTKLIEAQIVETRAPMPTESHLMAGLQGRRVRTLAQSKPSLSHIYTLKVGP
jgi:hypothetical protein